MPDGARKKPRRWATARLGEIDRSRQTVTFQLVAASFQLAVFSRQVGNLPPRGDHFFSDSAGGIFLSGVGAMGSFSVAGFTGGEGHSMTTVCVHDLAQGASQALAVAHGSQATTHFVMHSSCVRTLI